MAYTKILVPNLDTTNNPTQSEDVVGIISNTERTFNTSTVAGAENAFDYIDRNAPDGDFRRIQGVAVLINSIRNLLTTPRGSYPFDPEYGSDLYKMVFEPADKTTEEEIQIETIDRIKIFDDRVRIKNVTTQFFNNHKGYRINIVIIKDEVEAVTSLDFLENSAFVLQEA